MPKIPGMRSGTPNRPVTLADVARLVGDLDNEVLVSIIETGATYAEVEQAVTWAEGKAEQLGKEGHPLIGAAAMVYDILIRDPAFAPDREP